MLVGRGAEQQVLDRLFAGARIGRGGSLAITGDPGVGKTALLAESLDRVDGVHVLRATGTEAEQAIAFAGLHLLLRPALHLLDTLPEPQSEALSSALALRAGVAGDRFAIGAATLALLCRYAEQTPIAVVVDDLQWLDRPSAEALAFAARRIDDDPVVVLLAGRTGACEDLVDGLAVLELAGLDAASSSELVHSLETTAPTEDQVARLFEATGGNPLALLELGRSVELLDDRAPGLPPALPVALAAAFSRRLAQLDAGTRTALLAAVVANGDLQQTGEVCRRLGLDVSGLGPAEQAGLVTVAGGRIDVRHPLVRAAVYAEADESLRRVVHLTVADLLPDDAERRAWHLAEATWGPDAEVAQLLEVAGDNAAARTAYTVASTAYERAARLSPETERWHVLLCAAAEAAWTGGLRPRALALLDEIESRPVPEATRSRTLRIRAQIAARSGSVADAVRILERAAPDAPTPDDTVFLLAEALHAAFYLADAAVTKRLAAALPPSVEAATSPHARAVGLTAAGMSKVLSGDGGFDEIRAAVPLLAEHADPVAHPEALPWLLTTPLFLRDAESGADLRRIVDAVRSRMGVGLLPNVLFHVARDQATSTAWSRATANYEEGIRLARETGQGTDLAMSLAGLAWLESRQGRGDACREPRVGGRRAVHRARHPDGRGLVPLRPRRPRSSRRATPAPPPPRSSTCRGGSRSGASPTPTSPPAPSWWTRSSGSAAPPTRRPRRLDTRPLHRRRAGPGRRPVHTGPRAWWPTTHHSTSTSSPRSPATSTPATSSRRPAPTWRTAAACAAPPAGSTPACTCGPRSSRSRSSAPISGPAPPPPSSRRPARR